MKGKANKRHGEERMRDDEAIEGDNRKYEEEQVSKKILEDYCIATHKNFGSTTGTLESFVVSLFVTSNAGP